MKVALGSIDPLGSGDWDDVIDVRSPSEFAEDRLPGAISLPVLTDAQRAEVGTIYTREDRFRARRIGAAHVARNAAAHIEGALRDRGGGWRPLVYCWRGGQRSGAFAVILAQIGWRVGVVDGGYRAWRRMISEALYGPALAHRLILLDGNTGTAKTAILQRLSAQSLDLEGLAAHRGSVFGGVAGGQPSQKMFEGRLAAALRALDPARPTVVEAESSRIGEITLPPALWAAMRAAPRLRVEADLPVRAAYLARAYADVTAEPAALAARLEALVPLQGRAVVARWREMADAGAHEVLAGELMERHYDPRYARAKMREGAVPVARVPLTGPDDASIAAAAARVDALVARL